MSHKLFYVKNFGLQTTGLLNTDNIPISFTHAKVDPKYRWKGTYYCCIGSNNIMGIFKITYGCPAKWGFAFKAIKLTKPI